MKLDDFTGGVTFDFGDLLEGWAGLATSTIAFLIAPDDVGPFWPRDLRTDQKVPHLRTDQKVSVCLSVSLSLLLKKSHSGTVYPYTRRFRAWYNHLCTIYQALSRLVKYLRSGLGGMQRTSTRSMTNGRAKLTYQSHLMKAICSWRATILVWVACGSLPEFELICPILRGGNFGVVTNILLTTSL